MTADPKHKVEDVEPSALAQVRGGWSASHPANSSPKCQAAEAHARRVFEEVGPKHDAYGKPISDWAPGGYILYGEATAVESRACNGEFYPDRVHKRS
jgi:hypothetical protein